MKPPLSRPYEVNAHDQMFGTKENARPDPLRYDVHVDAPQEVARFLADLMPGAVARVRIVRAANRSRRGVSTWPAPN